MKAEEINVQQKNLHGQMGIEREHIENNNFTLRSNEEILIALRAFQERQRKWFEESDSRLKKRRHFF